jgi:prepilin-type N-terminal cleavage/methylation domain-containing protein
MIRQLIDRAQRKAGDLRSDAGFTLVEIIIAVSLLGLVTGAGVTSLVTATQGSSALSLSAHESSDAQLISAFLVRDAQAAGGTDPETGITDPSLGVSASDPAGCTPAGSTLKARFKWRDRKSTGSVEKVASYGLNGVHELVRRMCTDSISGGDLLLGTNVASAALTCDGVVGVCPAFPKFVTLSLSGTNTANPFSYKLTAQLRSESQDPPSTDNSEPVPILALGGATCPLPSKAFVTISGNSNLQVDLGGVTINSSVLNCDGLKLTGSATYSTDSTSVLTGPGTPCTGTCPLITPYTTPLLDPLRNLPVPPEAAQCAVPGADPGKSGTHYKAGVYRTLVTTNSGDTFDPGTYVFCNGLKISGDLSALNVLLYFAGGTLDMVNTPRVTLGPQTTLPYDNVSIWLPKTNAETKLTINGSTGISLYSGIVYAPAATVFVSGTADVRIASIIAYAIVLTGTGHDVFGPGVSITNYQMEPAFLNVPYSMQLTVEGGTPFPLPTPHYSAWSISSGNLPDGLSLNTATGLITGTPTLAKLFEVTFQISDSIRVATRTYTFNVGAGALTILTASLKAATLTAPYSETLLALSDAGGYRWTATGLPAWLSLNLSTGVIYGVPTGLPGDVNVNVTVMDAANVQTTKLFTLTINPPPSITTFSLPDTTVTALYSRTISSTGGTAPLSWSIKAGDSLPLGLNLTPDPILPVAVISGTVDPSAVGSTFTIVGTDFNGVQASQQYTVNVNPLPAITTDTLPAGDRGAKYLSPQMTATGGTQPLLWTATGLPSPMAMSSTGVISGAPGASGTFTVKVKATDSANVQVTKDLTLVIHPALVITGPASLPPWDAGDLYPPQTASVIGGSGGYSWAASGLPAGMSMSAGGVISGTPGQGSYDITITVTDSIGVSVSQSYTPLTIFPALTASFPTALPNWDVGILYPTQSGSVSGGSGGYVWSASGLPNGLAIDASTGAITGTPLTALGPNPVTIRVKDSVDVSRSATYNITIFGPVVVTPTLLSAWTVGRPYSTTFGANGGGNGPFVWSASGLPVGLTLSPSGVLSGTQNTAGTFNPVITVTDNGVGVGGGASKAIGYTLVMNPAPSLIGTLPVGDQSIGYSSGLSLTGGTGPLTWAAPTKPAFLSINALTGVLTGTPGSAGSFPVTITVTDATGATATANVTLTVRPPTPISISLNNGTGTVKKVDEGDTIVITYSQALDLATVCPGGTLPLAGNGNVTVTVNNGAGVTNDTITVTAASCPGVGGLHLGTIDLGSNAFVTATSTFGANGNGNDSTISWAANAITIKLGKQNPGGATAVVSVPNTATYTPPVSPSNVKSVLGVVVSGTASVTGTSPIYFF